jgi:hypothetical protein
MCTSPNRIPPSGAFVGFFVELARETGMSGLCEGAARSPFACCMFKCHVLNSIQIGAIIFYPISERYIYLFFNTYLSIHLIIFDFAYLFFFDVATEGRKENFSS